MSEQTHLYLVGGTKKPPKHRCSVAATVVLSGIQDIAVRGVTATASPRGYGHIAVRVGRILVYLEDRDSFNAMVEAMQRAEHVADQVFQPLDRPWERVRK